MNKKPGISIIVAATQDTLGIGCNGGIPWKLLGDLKNFRTITTSTVVSSKINAVVMGRKTWESIPLKYRPLKNRLNVILSKTLNPTLVEGECIRVESDIDECMKKLQDDGDSIEHIYIIGGSCVYERAMTLEDCKSIFVTWIEGSFECDTFLHKIDRSKFKNEILGSWNKEGDVRYRFSSYKTDDADK